MKEKNSDFNALFNDWAPTYDQTVRDTEGEYRDVFENYQEILTAVVQHVPKHGEVVLEFGVGTGNLSQKLMAEGYQVIGVEPSSEMRKIVSQKAIPMDLREGSFLDIPLSKEEKVDAIVSSYAFHHLTLEEKQRAIREMKSFLQPHGRIVFADACYGSKEEKQKLIELAEKQGSSNLLRDLTHEYYEYVDDLIEIYGQEGFQVEFSRYNQYVWLSVASLL